MRLKEKHVWFLAFTAVFAVLAGFVFWGAWGLDKAPVMPDCPVTHPANFIARWCDGWLENGKFTPFDLRRFLGSPYFWQELQYALAAYFAGLGLMYFLRGRGLSRLASYGAGLLLAFSGYWLTLFSAGHLGWFEFMAFGIFPFGLVDRALAKGRVRHWALLGATVAWGSMYQPDLWLLFTVFTGVYFVYRTIATARAAAHPKAFWTRWALGGLLALLVLAAIGLPSFHTAFTKDLAGRKAQIAAGETLSAASARQDDRARQWIFVTNWSMPPEAVFEFFDAGHEGDTTDPFVLALARGRGKSTVRYHGRLGIPKELEDATDPAARWNSMRQHSLYLGWVTCLLALAGLVFGRRRGAVWFFALGAVVFTLCAMGRYCEPVYRCIFALPFGDLLRAPVKWHHLTEFCVAVLAGFGLEGLLAALSRVWAANPRARVYASAAVSLVVLVGAIDLARDARKFCAPKDLETQYFPVPESQLARPDAQTWMTQNGVRTYGAAEFILPDGNGRYGVVPCRLLGRRMSRAEVRKQRADAPRTDFRPTAWGWTANILSLAARSSFRCSRRHRRLGAEKGSRAPRKRRFLI